MRLLRRLLAPLLALALSCGGGASPTTPAPPGQTTCAGTPGVACFGRSNYVEYLPGDAALVISVPHGGALTPAAIPDRTIGTTVTDTNTIELGRAVVTAYQSRTGRRPHLVIAHLRRTKLDANRDVVEGAAGNADATRAWNEYHAFIEQAMTAVARQPGRGFYIDLHGHGHPIARLELGYLLSAASLDLSDAQLNTGGLASQSSLRLAMPTSPATFSEILRGPTSLGGLLAARLPSVPSPQAASPAGAEYFTGGYSTERHTTTLAGLQIETHVSGVRDTAANRAAFGDTLSQGVVTFMATHLGLVAGR